MPGRWRHGTLVINKSLRTLNLTHNNIGDCGALAILEKFKRFPTLENVKKIQMKFNGLTEKSTGPLFEVFNITKSESIKLSISSGNVVSDDTFATYTHRGCMLIAPMLKEPTPAYSSSLAFAKANQFANQMMGRRYVVWKNDNCYSAKLTAFFLSTATPQSVYKEIVAMDCGASIAFYNDAAAEILGKCFSEMHALELLSFKNNLFTDQLRTLRLKPEGRSRLEKVFIT